ncbi:Aminotransferase [Balamuthia mandrillaris]
MVGPGSKELMFILNICLQAKVLLPIPSWVSYGPQASLFGNEVHWLSTRFENKWLLTAEELDTFCKQHSSTGSSGDTTMLLVLNYPSNPTGASYNEQQLKELGEVARRHHLFILSDEIYGQLHHEGRHLSLSKFYPEGTILSSGISKWCGAGGWRLGTFLFPPTTRSILPADLKQAVSAVASESFSAVSAPVQHAAIAAYDRRLERGDGVLGDTFEDDYYLPGQRLVLKSLAGRFVQRLREDGLRVAQPDGGFYLWLDFSPFRESLFQSKRIRFSNDLVMKLLEETGVALLAGSHFGSCSGHLQNGAHQHGGAEEPLTARLAYVNFDGEKALSAAVTHLQRRPPPDGLLSDDFLQQHCGRTMSGLEHLLSWLPSS